ncbi:hypothetical protein D3C76_1142310 [compost metagenome]
MVGSGAKVSVVIGDGKIQLTVKWAGRHSHLFDVVGPDDRKSIEWFPFYLSIHWCPQRPDAVVCNRMATSGANHVLRKPFHNSGKVCTRMVDGVFPPAKEYGG